MDDLQITMTDLKRAGFNPCFDARRWFAEHGLSDEFRLLIKGKSFPASKLIETGDANALRVVQAKIERELAGVDLSEVVITLDDAREACKCAEGMQAFALRCGFDFRDFARNGIPAEYLIATGDPEALEVVRLKVCRG